jgi:hypothetical protein
MHFFEFSAVSIKSLKDLPQNSFATPQGQKCKHGSFGSIIQTFSEYSNLVITPWGEQDLLVIQMTDIYM